MKGARSLRFSCFPEKESCLSTKAFSKKLKSLPLKTVERICAGRIQRLTFGAVSVSTGVVGDLPIAAVLTS